MNNRTAAVIAQELLIHASRDFFEGQALHFAEDGHWAAAKALEIFADLTPDERAQALAPAPATRWDWGKGNDFTDEKWDQVKIATGCSQNADDYHWAYRSEVPDLVVEDDIFTRNGI